tara:strand:- start:148 stop:267 length:120 start_codon:yes stop_codon:yes gene_type:complete
MKQKIKNELLALAAFAEIKKAAILSIGIILIIAFGIFAL